MRQSSCDSDQGKVMGAVDVPDALVSESVLDSGASVVFRWAGVEEYSRAVTVPVTLPLGASAMKALACGSLVTLDTRSAILPLGRVIKALGVQVQWDDTGVQVWHPIKGLLDVRVCRDRLVLGSAHTRFLVQELEAYEGFGLDDRVDDLSFMNALKAGSEEEDIAVSLRYVEPKGSPLALLDGGATNSLKTGTPEELREGKPVSVELATGRTTLTMSSGGTLLTDKVVTPIVPLGKAISVLRCNLQWDENGCTFSHPQKGPLPVELKNGCPMVPQNIALDLINELESAAYKRQIRLKALSMLKDKEWHHRSLSELLSQAKGDEEAEAVALMMYAKQMFPHIPEELLEKIVPSKASLNQDEEGFQTSGLNRRIRRRVSRSKRVLVHLFSGVQSWKGVDGDVVLEIERDKGRDLMNETLFIYLLGLILQGKVKGIVGGPPCTRFSRARSRSPGPRVISGREGHERFGLQGFSLQEYDQLERDNVLILRMMFLVQLAQEVSDDSCFVAIEHPRDPMLMEGNFLKQKLPSLWCWPEMQNLNLLRAEVDQGRPGHSHVKPTTIATNIAGVCTSLSITWWLNLGIVGLWQTMLPVVFPKG